MNRKNVLALLVAAACSFTQAMSAPTGDANAAEAAAAAAQLELKAVDDQAGIELYTPSFVPNSNKIAIVRKRHEPDGHEAEAYSEKELAAFNEQTKKNVRWGDPEVSIVPIDGAEPTEVVDFGWSTAVTPDGKTLFYSHQETPISGKRLLAESQKGNQLYSFDLTMRKPTLVTAPEAGYIDSPLASPDGKTVAYELCDAINGAWGGGVGVGLYDVASGKSKVVLAPAKHFELFDLVSAEFWVGDSLIVTRKTPLSSGTFIADKYKTELLRINASGVSPLYESKGSGAKDEDSDVDVFLTGGGADTTITVVDGSKLVQIDALTGKTLKTAMTKEPETAKKSAAGYSPDRKFHASVDEDNVLIIATADSKRTRKTKLPGEVRDMVWSPDSKRLAVVVTKEKAKDGMPVFDRDALMMVTLPADF